MSGDTEDHTNERLEDRIAQAIGDPGSFLPRGDDYRESVTRWATRAVMTIVAAELAAARTERDQARKACDEWEDEYARDVRFAAARAERAEAERDALAAAAEGVIATAEWVVEDLKHRKLYPTGNVIQPLRAALSVIRGNPGPRSGDALAAKIEAALAYLGEPGKPDSHAYMAGRDAEPGSWKRGARHVAVNIRRVLSGVGGNPTPTAPDPSKCPDCDSVGRYDGRVMIGGRGVYRCECGTAWQNLDETPSTKGSIVVGGVSGSPEGHNDGG